ncbi:iron ABC transporter permease [Desulfosporosinus sp. PR]|uniref:FecCD family ABC transporter permease n=1 Tax=Candidatus Desulfosporosinus nitrosoreducens TaxID=3401928 RepID=UPI0027E7F847|nr:iron ABC transporter permease [Desulfosporosinus sp. PR]MDQ7095739.1 iron ABC transporter permease [Desulfosporosinus sp. PR]
MNAPQTALSRENIKQTYIRKKEWLYLLLALCLAATFMAIVAAVGIGSAGLSPLDVGNSILSGLFPHAHPVRDALKFNIVWELRLPRIILAVLAGAGLSIAGVVLQALTRNPLVSPFTIGLSNAAALGASVSIVAGAAILGSQQLAITVGAFCGAAACGALVYAISAQKRMSAVAIVLTGTALTYLFSALTNTMQFFSNTDALSAIVNWTFGNLSGTTYSQAFILGILLAVVFAVFLRQAWALNALSSGGDEIARGLGINASGVRTLLGVLSVILTACIVSFTGVIGFVGIIGPHIARLLIGADHKFLLPFSAIFGGILTLAADTLGRTLFAPLTIPVGIVVAYIGVPIFLHLILSKKEMYFQ